MLSLTSAAVLGALAFAQLALAAPTIGTPVQAVRASRRDLEPRRAKISPKVMIVSMFSYERALWVENLELHHNTSVPLLSPLYPKVGCNKEGSVCIYTTGEAEINAAASGVALLLSDRFEFKDTYWLISGIAGVNPYEGTLGSVAISRFAVQVGLEQEIDAREIPANWTTGYFAQNTDAPGELPDADTLYGTELFELNTNLADKVYDLVKDVKLNYTEETSYWASTFPSSLPASKNPTVIQCDTTTSDAYFAGTLLSQQAGNWTTLLTRGEGKYCMTAQEDNATLEAMTRAAAFGIMDYGRVILMRGGSDFDRKSPTSDFTAVEAFETSMGGFDVAVTNLYLAGAPVVKEIVGNWKEWKHGVAPQVDSPFYGDDLGTLRNGTAYA